jgi:hypothetical protein
MTDPQFATWADRKAIGQPILALEANAGFGKSYLCSSVIRHLSHLYPSSRYDFRVSIAYHFFQTDKDDNKDKDKDKDSVNKALRALIWQLAQNDPVYQKSVAAACDKPEEFANSIELWKQLVVKLSPKIDAMFFIVLDGIDDAETESGKPLLEMFRDVLLIADEKRPLSIRLFVTGRPKAFAEIQKASNISIPSIHLGVRNEDDILKYVDARMDSMDILKKSDQDDIRELRSRIRTDLTEGAQGDFFKLNYMLTEISTKRRRKEIEEVLEHAGEDRQDTIAREIDRLNKTLGQEDIQDLNELLAWVIGSKQWPTIRQLEAVLLVKNGESSLVPLEEQIRDKYTALLDIWNDGETVSLQSDSIVEYLRTKSAAAAQDQASGGTTSVHPSEVAIVKRFLRNVCDDDLFNKLGFEEFFKSKLVNHNASINVDPENFDIPILISCLKAICGEPKDETMPLFDYAFYWLPDHLDGVDLALAAPDPKSQIGSLLIRLFADEECINRWWIEDRMWMRAPWVYADENVDTALKWFKDSAVVKGLSDEHKEWVNGLTSNSKPDDDLLKPLAVIMAKRWTQTAGWSVSDLFFFLHGFITKV